MVTQNIEDVYVLSPMQSGLLYHAVSQTTKDAYFLQTSWTIESEIEVELMKQAWEMVIAHHPILRTGFVWENQPKPRQVVLRHVRLPFAIEDWSDLSDERQAADFELFLEADRRRGFVLEQAPLMRLTLIRCAENKYRLIWSHHHLLLDGWSSALILQQVLSSYESLLKKEPVRLPVSRPYRDYIQWLRQQDETKARDYWREYLNGVEGTTRLGIERRRRTAGTTAEAEVTAATEQISETATKQISETATEQLFKKEQGYRETEVTLNEAETVAAREYVRRAKQTLNTLVQGAWSVLASRYSGQSEVLFGATVAGRPAELSGFEEMVGLFINTLPVRVKLSGEETVDRLLERIGRMAVEQREYEYSSLTQIRKASGMTGGGEMFEQIVVFENYPVDEALKNQPLSFIVSEIKSLDRTSYPFTLVVGAKSDALVLKCSYDLEKYSSESIERLLNHLRQIIVSIVKNKDAKIKDLEFMTPEEKNVLLNEWVNKETFPKSETVIARFEQQVERTPDAVAVSDAGESLTYRELNQRANRLARRLINAGIRRESLVGLYLERNVSLTVAVLGVLKAGGGYVPLDPAYPSDRLAYMATDAKVEVVIRNCDWKDDGRIGNIESEIDLRDSAEWADESAENLPIEIEGEQLAYIIYTSGSTGKPKGSLITHSNVARLFSRTEQWFNFSDKDVWTLFHSYAFDFSVWEMWGALIYGGRLVVVPYLTSRSPESFYQLLIDEKVTVLNQTPSAFRQLSKVVESEFEKGNKQTTSLREVIFGGEALDIESLRGWFDIYGDRQPRLVNMYGITETTVHVTYRPITREDVGGNSSVIGGAIPDLGLYVLDKYLNPVPVGIVGELFVGGEGLGRGYHRRGDISAERFIPNPFGQTIGERLYRTGDLVRYLENGDIEYIGRADDQVKIRGFRIETKEIESVINEHPEIGNSIVSVYGSEENKKLVAYIIRRKNGRKDEFDLESLKNHLRSKLPDFMIPAPIVEIEALPLTPNGKIDFKALPSPANFKSTEDDKYVKAETPEQILLVKIWEQVLQISPIGLRDNFFDLGGDSILILQIVSKVRQQGYHITPKMIFENPTVEELAQVLKKKSSTETERKTVEGEAPLTPIQKWFFERKLAKPEHFNQAVMINVGQQISPVNLKKAFDDLYRHHDALRLRFKETEGVWKQHYAQTETGEFLFQVDLSAVDEKDRKELIYAEADKIQQSFNLADGPLLKAVLFDGGADQPKRLLIVIHHLVVDGVSWRIIFDDLYAFYDQSVKGEKTVFPAKTTSYKHWSEFLVRFSNEKELLEEADYWKSIEKSYQELPVDLSGKDNTTGSSDSVSIELTTDETEKLLQRVPEVYRTRINDVLLTALAFSFANWTGNEKLLIDLEGFGREELVENIDLTRTVGWFTTIYPVLLEADKNISPVVSLKNNKERLRNIPRNGIGYGLLKYLSGENGLTGSANARPQILFNYLGQFDQMLSDNPLFGIGEQIVGKNVGGENRREYLLEIDSMIVGGRLLVNWSFGTNVHKKETVERLAENYRQALVELIELCLETNDFGYTPSDFPLARLDQPQLDKLTAGNRRIENIYPLSHTQKGILFHSLLNPEQEAYFIQFCYEIDGWLDVDILKRAWLNLIDRHPVLRTSFVWDNPEENLQIVWEKADLAFEELDWQTESERDQQTKLKEYLAANKSEGFDFGKAPLTRIALIKTAAQKHYLVWSMHHIILDGWSLPILTSEVFAAYYALANDREIEIKSPVPYAEYIAWLEKQNLETAKEYWQTLLRDFTSQTPLPTRSFLGKRTVDEKGYGLKELVLSAAQSESLRKLANRHNLTLNNILQAAWGFLLSVYSNRKEVVFGVTLSGRSAEIAGIDKMIGLFINTLPLLVDCSGKQTVLDLLEQVRNRQIELQQYDFVPLSELQKWSDMPPGANLFENIFVFENYPAAETQNSSDTGGLQIKDVRSLEETNYPLTITVDPQEAVQIKCNFQKWNFDETDIAVMLEHLGVILENIPSFIDKPLQELPYLNQPQKIGKILSTNGHHPIDEILLLPERFEQQVKKTPDAIAVSDAAESLTYRELNQRANQLARRLAGIGVKRESLVGLYLERNVSLTVAVLGVLKAGGGYVPLDPAYPSERLAYMATDAKVEVVIRNCDWKEDEAKPENVRHEIDLRDSAKLTNEIADNLGTKIEGEQLAYVIYTSGSTGKPKGVGVSHSALSIYLDTFGKEIKINAADKILQFANYSFDTSVDEIFLPIVNGAQTVFKSDDLLDSYENFINYCSKKEISILDLPTAFWHELVDWLDSSETGLTETIRTIIVGGERMKPEKLEIWHRLGQSVSISLFNSYGPTETTVSVSAKNLDKSEPLRKEVSLGKLYDGVDYYVLNPDGNPTPFGVPGELFIGGKILSRGYLNKPELTAESFIPNPFSRKTGSRLYKTGDLVRQLSNGELEYVSRLDEQIKIRGFRIETGEIEAVLFDHPKVSDCVVRIRETDKRSPKLCAFIVLNEETEKTSANFATFELKEYLKNKIPVYMMPDLFLFPDFIPLTPNGKIDYKQLLESVSDAENRISEPPQTETERILAEIWKEILDVETVGRDDNFFELGGHSLVITRLTSKIKAQFNINLSLKNIFENQTIAEQAFEIDNAVKAENFVEDKFAVLERPENIPLSFSQQRLWFLSRLDNANSSYNIFSAFTIKGKLSLDILEKSVNVLVRRHESLRTNFHTIHDIPVQTIKTEFELTIPVIDLRKVPKADRKRRIEKIIAEETGRNFDLSNDILFRVLLLKLKNDEHIMIYVLHHIIGDGWSMNVLTREFARIYQALSNGESAHLPELEVQYADYSIRQRNYLDEEKLNEKFAFWKSKFGENPPPLELPIDKARPKLQTFNGDAVPLKLDGEIVRKLKELAVKTDTTPFMILLSVYKILLARLSRRKEITVGIPIANRNESVLENVVGFFVNTLVLKSDLKPHMSYLELLRELRGNFTEAFEHQDMPFELLVEKLNPDRDLSRSPLFQAMFNFQVAEKPEAIFSEIEISPFSAERKTAKFEISLELEDSPEGILGWLEYNSDLFEAETVNEIARQYTKFVAELLESPTAEIAKWTVLSKAEKQALVESKNDYSSPLVWQGTIIDHIEKQVERTPDAIAVSDAGESLTYRELNQRANQLARALSNNGVGRESLVGLYLERNVSLTVAVLGVLKAGGGYVPLDPAYPAERLAYMATDAKVEVVIRNCDWKEDEAKPENVRHEIDLRETAEWTNETAENPGTKIEGEQLAYVIYTSGSTGKPKGVIIRHQSVLALLEWANDEFSDEVLKGTLAATSLNFDLSVYEMFLPLIKGGKVLIARNLLEIGSLKDEVRLINTVPSVMAEFLRFTDLPPNAQVVNLAGEALPRELINDLYAKKIEKVWNLYGPSEDTTYSTAGLMEENDSRQPHIGKPLRGSFAYLLDEEFEPVGEGITGEIYLSGAGLGRGYLHQPAMTAQKFLPDPFDRSSGGRMYATGDLGRWRSDGVIEYAGRADTQIKLRGYRIELGEIEAVIRGLEEIAEAAVVVKGTGSGKRLVAYVVRRKESAENNEEVEESINWREDLREKVSDKLPAYMIPEVWTEMERLPQTASGKIDRRELTNREDEETGEEREIVAAESEWEKRLVAVWSDILENDKIGITDNFFTVGGHSLKATRIVSRLRSRYGLEIPLREIFEKPTIREFAAEAERLAEQNSARTTINKADRDENGLPLSFAQHRLWFLQKLFPESTAYNLITPIRLKGALNIDWLARAWEELELNQESLRTTFIEADENVLQVIGEPKEFEFKRETRPADKTEKEWIADILEEENGYVYDLEAGPLYRWRYLEISETERVLILGMHHIISDGWSMGILMEQLTQLYQKHASGISLEGKDKFSTRKIQYADYALAQQQILTGDYLNEKLDYWRENLSGAPQILELPTDRKRPASLGNEGSGISFKLDAEDAEALKGISHLKGITLSTVMLAAYEVLLHKWSGHRDLLIGMPVAGRIHEEVEEVIGFFVNTLVMRSRVERGMTWSEKLSEVSGQVVSAMENQEIPFEMLVDEMGVERHLNRTPLVQVMYVMQNAGRNLNTKSELEITYEEILSKTAKFELSLEISEEGDGLRGWFEYNRELFDEETIKNLTVHYRKILKEISSNIEGRIGETGLQSAEENLKNLERLAGERRDYKINRGLHESFEEQAARTPKKLAVMTADGKEQLTYSELNEQANRLARYLKRNGLTQNGAEKIVGIMQGKTVNMVVAIFAALKSGASYILLDEQLPVQRLEEIIADSGIGFVISNREIGENIPDGKNVFSVDTEKSAEAIEKEDGTNLGLKLTGQELAYLIYTSGSTGKQKGVAIAHSAIINHMEWMQERFPLTEDDRVLQKTPVGFDAAVWEFYAPLLTGATLILGASGGHRNSQYLVENIQNHKITILQLVPTQLEMLVEEEGFESCLSLRRIFIGGEELRTDLAAKSRELLPTAETVNLYGPSECTIDATYWVSEETIEAKNEERVPLGKAVTNMSVYVLDEEFEPVGEGITGEIYLSGAGLGRGYLHQPAMTAQKFLPDPFDRSGGGRMYATGDLGRWRSDGVIEYAGRADTQIKLRGYRIELGEIEAVIRGLEEIAEAAVVVKGTGSEKRLVAYVVRRKESAENNEEVEESINWREDLREKVSDKLPAYMIPEVWTEMERLPQTASGKIDRRELTNREDEETGEEREIVAAESEWEKRLVAVWSDVLGKQDISIKDSFFEIGGHSLSAVRVRSRLDSLYKVKINLIDIFKFQTIEALAEQIEKNAESKTGKELLVEINKGELQTAFYAVHPVGGNVTSYFELSEELGTDHGFYGIQSPDLTTESHYPASIGEMAEKYILELRKHNVSEGFNLGGWSMGGVIALEMAAQLENQGKKINSLTLIDSYLPTEIELPTTQNALIKAFAINTGINLRNFDFDFSDDENASTEEIFEKLVAYINHNNSDISGIEQQDILTSFELYKHNSFALRTHEPQKYSGDVTLLRATLNPNYLIGKGDHSQWKELIDGQLNVINISADHFSVMTKPAIKKVAQIVKNIL